MEFPDHEIRFVNSRYISDNLQCIICQCIFQDPKRLGCGHTYCDKCIKGVLKNNNKCPECRSLIDLRKLKRDLIAYNIINDEIVYCTDETQYCKWKGPLHTLQQHMLTCEIILHGVPEYIREIEKQDSKIELTQQQQLMGEKFEDKLKQHDEGSLVQRLFQKNKGQLSTILEKKPSPEPIQKAISTLQQEDDDIEAFMNYLDDDNYNYQQSEKTENNIKQEQIMELVSKQQSAGSSKKRTQSKNPNNIINSQFQKRQTRSQSILEE